MIDMIEKEEPIISEEEAAQYDRQIRLWGLDAQKRLRGSRVLLVGLGGLGAEVAKNLILAGVKGLTLLDHEQVTEESCRAQFLVPVMARGQNRAQASLERAQYLNPMVEVRAYPDRPEDKPDDFFLQFDAVCLTGCSRDLMVRVDQLCSQRNIKVFCGDVYGYYGYMFSDLGKEHHYVDIGISINQESIIGIQWNKLLKDHHTDGNYIYGYVTSEASVYTVLELHKRLTTTTFSIRDSSSLQFNPTKIDKDKVKFSPRYIFYSKSSSPCIPDDGVPFLFGGRKILECQFGPRKVRPRQGEEKEASDTLPGNNDDIVLDHDYGPSSGQTTVTNDRQRFHIQDTRKKGCEAKITIKQICRFPQYAISCKKNLNREQKKTKERLLKDLREGKEVDIENRYYVELPLNKAHTKHTLGGVSGVAQTVHPTITQWIDQLVGEGMTDSQEIQATLRHYVKTRMTDTAAPSELDRAFYPKLKDIKNHIYLAKIKLRITKLDQDNFRQKLEDWKTDGACSFFRPYRNNNPTTISAADQSVQEGLIACVEMETAEPDPTQHESDVTEQPPSFPAPEESDEVVDSDVYEETLLFVHQEKWQQDVLKQHGNTICLIDATHKTTKYDLALFFISVQTNCGYIVVAVFIVQSEKACHIKEALKVLKEWNPGWDPKFWMCDFSDAECNALQSAFPNTQVYLCDFHREQAWTRWVRNSKHGLSREEGEQLLHLLRGITAAPPGDTEVDEHYQRHVGILKASSLWKKPQVRVWLESKWLSIPERWARAFRNSIYHAAVGTTNLVESQKKVLKYSYLKKAKGDKTISSILDVIINHYLPAHHQEYVFAQYNTSEEHRLYNEKGPEFLQNRQVSSENSPAEEAQEPDDRVEIYAEAIPRRRTNTHPEPAANESRKRAREALETLQAMICSCTNGPALDTLTAGIEALTQSFKEFLDECPEGLPLLPHTSPHSHSGKQKGMETDPTPLPLAKSATRDRSDYTYRGGCGVKADAAREKPKTVKPAQGSSDGPEAKKAKIDPNETTMVKKTASFCSLKEALEVDWTSEKAKASLKRTPVDYFLLHVLLKFRTDKGRDPDPQSFAEDSQLLRQIRDDVLESLAVSGDLLSDDFVSYCFSEMSPVCAVVGGVLGQEVVKALSQRDAPHRNFFFFDGRKGNGVVDYFGPN